MSILYRMAYHVDDKYSRRAWYEHLSVHTVLKSGTETYPRGESPRNAAGSVTETAPKWQFLCVKKSPLRYCQFRASARDIRYNVVIAVEKKKRTKNFLHLCLPYTVRFSSLFA